MQAYCNLPSDYEVRPEFRKSMINLETDYVAKTDAEKTVIKEDLLNQLVDPERYKSVMSYRAGPGAVERSRKRVRSMVDSSGDTTPDVTRVSETDCSETVHSHSDGSNTDLTFNYIRFKLQERVGGDPAEIRGLVTKAMELIAEDKVTNLIHVISKATDAIL